MRTQTPNVSTTPPLKPMKPESTHPKDAETWAGKQSPSTNIYDCMIRPSSLIDFCRILVTSDLRKHGSIYPNLQPPPRHLSLHPSIPSPWVTNLPPINREVKAHHHRIVLGVEIEGVEIHRPNLTTWNAWLHMAA